ncbi:MAG: valine--tRNA ligase [Bdellovibrio sp. CG10_big_fil_rev_8_21_14_0_10_47_8]|nr:MAG: valine--tRNA ligase [Bdellovibrio sp. CG10_big_fil_rev_8_21_14_0_10_47_8]
MSDRYSPADVEEKVYAWWEQSGFFKAQDQSTKPPYSVILPPPNVTGFLHLGHAVDHTVQDVLVRWKRMNGFNVLWLPGTDHAGIATQAVVEKELKKENLTRHQLGREKFVARVWEWKHQYGDRIYSQMRKLGDSCDWDRAVFTLDEGVSKAVRKVFVSLYKKSQIYRGTRLVNWSGPLESAISDLEVEHRQIKGSLWHIKYQVEGTQDFLIVATTRPETLLGDSAVCVHPDDERYKHLIGKHVVLPLLGRKIPIIADTYVDPQFGSGVVKITPAHDFNDYKIGKTHQLPMINILTKKCELNENAGPYKGLKVQEARKRILEDLKTQGLLEKEEPHALSVGHCSRTGAVVEPFLSDQWFMKMDQLAVPAKRVVESGTIRFEPESWTKVYLHWMNIIEDWCISRQLWWGHQIPAWYCEDCQHITVSETDVTECETCHSKNVRQDEDVLDTWFSSALWPFSTMGWPQETETAKTFYPTSILVTGHDILFFWVARMIMMGLEFKRDVPFREVYLHGLVRDSQGRKMSKSLGNSVDPVEMIGKYGADALRFSFIAHLFSGKDFKFSEQRIEGYRNFMNKIWNGTRFALAALQDFQIPTDGLKALPNKIHLSVYDQWLIFKLGEVEKTVEESMEQHRFSDATNALYQFVWYEFCDWYIEFMKPVLNGAPSVDRENSQLVVAQTLNRIMRLLHPFVPFITEELYQKLPLHDKTCMLDQYPNPRNDREFLALGSETAALEVDLIKEVISAIRNIRGENRISPAQKINVRLVPGDGEVQKHLAHNKSAIMTLGRIENFEIGDEGNLSKCALAVINVKTAQVKVVIPLEGLVDIEEEVKRIQKLVEKLTKDIGSLSGRLNNENFVKNAAEEVVEADRQLLAQSKNQLQNLQDSLTRLR